MFTFQKNYFILAIILLGTEVFIALFMHDRIIRPYVGDFLVVILMYTATRTFIDSPVYITLLIVLLSAYILETLQYFKHVQYLGLGDSGIARTLIGSSFAWIDILAYTLGVITVLGIETARSKNAANETRRWNEIDA